MKKGVSEFERCEEINYFYSSKDANLSTCKNSNPSFHRAIFFTFEF
jgi:hypothetical protein